MDDVTRRRLLAASSATLVAGCLEGTAPVASPANDTDDGPAANSSPPDESGPGSCPEYGERVDRVICYDDVSDDPIYLEPSSERVVEGESIEFTLENGTDERLASNFYNWRVHKYVGEEWHHVAPMGYKQPLMSLEPGESHTWTVTVSNENLDDVGLVFGSSATEDVTLASVGAGHYAFRARGWFESESHEEALAFAATFDLEGEPLELTPSNAVEETEREGETLVARSSRGDPDDEDSRLGAFEVERVDEPDEGDAVRPTIVEQLFRRPRLRDAIALSIEHDARTVRLEEYDTTHPIFGSRSDGVYEYGGAYYRVSTRELEK